MRLCNYELRNRQHRNTLTSPSTSPSPAAQSEAIQTLYKPPFSADCQFDRRRGFSPIVTVYDSTPSHRGEGRSACEACEAYEACDTRDTLVLVVSRRRWIRMGRGRWPSPQQLIFVDESGVDKRTGARRTGWAPKGLKAHRSTVLERGQRYQILPALALDGIVDVVIYPGTTNGDGFFAWISQGLLPKCAAFPAPKSVIVMDNASFHRRRDIKEACDAAGVILEFLPPYSPDFNPIEAFFGDLKRLFRQQYPIWNRDEADE
ncbi:TPR domain-containing protein [Colletotrichum higginsianum IMI 349063]|uniref:TPR domain-containing protein n=1 Tax=Colletotrichum higginsianum (strain IMI 349063) TaxID=759273 RepID=A0A1B7XQY8_COLHI|nr:TPR domain-containing protein [Colletotrichum higginsianum IMI 349063]OBR02178.1 TPR domain-containing protein [Colletotrichum higginsianum IMI 349063]